MQSKLMNDKIQNQPKVEFSFKVIGLKTHYNNTLK